VEKSRGFEYGYLRRMDSASLPLASAGAAWNGQGVLWGETMRLTDAERKTLRIALSIAIDSERELIQAHSHLRKDDSDRLYIEETSGRFIEGMRAILKRLK
jgi:hypothetical protein